MIAEPIGVDADTLAATYPRAYHLTHLDNWDLIQRIGLLSTSALLDLFGVEENVRAPIERQNRRDLVPIRSDAFGLAILRDQKPMDDRGLRRALKDGLQPNDWYQRVNQYAFLWVNRRRVDTLLGARAYRASRHLLLVVRTADLLNRHAANIVLSPLNTGATKPMPHPRGNDCFVPMATYPFASWRQKRGRREAVVELAVRGAVPDLLETLEQVAIVGRGEPEQVIWPQ